MFTRLNAVFLETILIGTARSFGNTLAPTACSGSGSNFPGMIQGPTSFSGAGVIVGFGQQSNVLSSITPNLLQSSLNPPPIQHFSPTLLQQLMAAAMGGTIAPQQICPEAQEQAAQIAQQVGQNPVNGLPIFINTGLSGTNSSSTMIDDTDVTTDKTICPQQQQLLAADFSFMAPAAAASLPAPVFSHPQLKTISGQIMPTPKSMMYLSQATNKIMTGLLKM